MRLLSSLSIATTLALVLVLTTEKHVNAFSVQSPSSKNASTPKPPSTPTPPPPIQAGDKVPWVNLDWGFPPQKVNIPKYVHGRSVIIVGLPGAFTPT